MRNKINIIISFADISFTIIFFILLSIHSDENTNKKKEENSKIIKILKNSLYWEDRKIDIYSLDKLLSNYKYKTITIKSDKFTIFDTIYRIIEIIKTHKIENIIFIYENS